MWVKTTMSTQKGQRARLHHEHDWVGARKEMSYMVLHKLGTSGSAEGYNGGENAGSRRSAKNPGSVVTVKRQGVNITK